MDPHFSISGLFLLLDFTAYQTHNWLEINFDEDVYAARHYEQEMRPFVSSIRFVSEEVNSQFSGFVCLQSSIFSTKNSTLLYIKDCEKCTFFKIHRMVKPLKTISALLIQILKIQAETTTRMDIKTYAKCPKLTA